MKSLGGQRVAILIQRTRESLIIEEFRGSKGSYFDAQTDRVSKNLHRISSRKLPREQFLNLLSDFGGPGKGEHFQEDCRAMVWVVILIQRTSESLIIEEFRWSKGSDFDAAHEGELDC